MLRDGLNFNFACSASRKHFFCINEHPAIYLGPGSAFIKPDQLDPWNKDQVGNALLSTVLALQLRNFVSCGGGGGGGGGGFVARRIIFILSFIHGSGWSGLIKAEPGVKYNHSPCYTYFTVEIKAMIYTQIARFMGQTWGPPGSCRPQMGPMLAPWTLLSGIPPVQNIVRQWRVTMISTYWFPETVKDIPHSMEHFSWLASRRPNLCCLPSSSETCHRRRAGELRTREIRTWIINVLPVHRTWGEPEEVAWQAWTI